VVLAAPFLAAHPAQYLGRAFEFGRQFQQQWSVNLQFLPPAVFAARHTALLLLGLHLALLAGARRWMGRHHVHATVAVSHSRDAGFAHTRWLRREGGLVPLLRGGLRRLTGAPPALRALTPEHVAAVMFEANFVGIVAARSLHFQFYSWCVCCLPIHYPSRELRAGWPGRRYGFTLPFMVWRTRLPTALKLLLLAGIEACWNVYPPTAATSVALAACHVLLVVALLATRMEGGSNKRIKRR
jgi:alpha-1,3-mannosyltransferase